MFFQEHLIFHNWNIHYKKQARNLIVKWSYATAELQSYQNKWLTKCHTVRIIYKINLKEKKPKLKVSQYVVLLFFFFLNKMKFHIIVLLIKPKAFVIRKWLISFLKFKTIPCEYNFGRVIMKMIIGRLFSLLLLDKFCISAFCIGLNTEVWKTAFCIWNAFLEYLPALKVIWQESVPEDMLLPAK